MSTEITLQNRSESTCELCSATTNLAVYEIPPSSNGGADECVLICGICREQIDNPEQVDVHHWRCLNDSMWNQTPVVQVMAWRILKCLSTEPWSQDLLDFFYLDKETQDWAQATDGLQSDENNGKHIDSNGATIAAGDTVTLIKDLKVKGANFTANHGTATAVRGISLVADNPEQIEGRINGQQTVILCKFVKKA